MMPGPTDGAEPHLPEPPLPTPKASATPSVLEQMMENPAFENALKSASTVIGRELGRSIFGKRRRR